MKRGILLLHEIETVLPRTERNTLASWDRNRSVLEQRGRKEENVIFAYSPILVPSHQMMVFSFLKMAATIPQRPTWPKVTFCAWKVIWSIRWALQQWHRLTGLRESTIRKTYFQWVWKSIRKWSETQCWMKEEREKARIKVKRKKEKEWKRK